MAKFRKSLFLNGVLAKLGVEAFEFSRVCVAAQATRSGENLHEADGYSPLFHRLSEQNQSKDC